MNCPNATKLRTLVCLGLISSLVGCSTFQKNTTSPSPDDRGWSMDSWFRKDYQIPESLAVIWSEDVLTMPGATPTRGFGGRVYFYNGRSQAIPVDGELIIHGFLTTGRDSENEKVSADKKFAYTAEQLTTHFSPSELGASYSIWIPWDAEGGFREEITLIPTFKPTAGGVVQGAPAKLYLPGKSRVARENENSGLMNSVSYRRKVTLTNDGVLLPKVGQSLATRSDVKIDENANRLTTTINVPQDGVIARRRSFTLSEATLRGTSSVDAAKRSFEGLEPTGSATTGPSATRCFTLPPQPSQQPKQNQGTPTILEDLSPPLNRVDHRHGIPRWQANLPVRNGVQPVSFPSPASSENSMR